MKKLIIKNIYPITLIFIVLVICMANYQPGTILSGWDTLHPEFNFKEYFSRVFFGAWQQHQGLGALATQAHASEMPRTIIYYCMSWFLPTFFIRYAYFFLTLLLGPLGVYFVLKTFILKNSRKVGIFSFLGALFYLLNLTTVQHYIVPFEMFATHFASLPWLFYLMLKYLFHPNRKNLVYFTIITTLASSIAHTATLWYSYFLGLLLFLLAVNLFYRNKNFLKHSVFIIVITFLVNLFWLLPDLYFAITSGNLISLSKIHSLFTEEAFSQNVAFGKVQDLLIFKNFLFNWGVYTGNSKFNMLLSDWIIHLKNPFILSLGYLFATIYLLGIINAIKERDKLQLSFLSIFLISSFFLFSVNPPLGFLFAFLQKTIPLFQEAFRFPFTKFSILLTFSCAIYFAIGLNFIFIASEKIKKNDLVPQLFLFLFTLFLIIYSFPAFQGKLISQYMKTKIPNEYFQMFSWFNKQDSSGRIAELPINSFWGWSYYNWGYQGAGFLWFGIKQPLLDREFDRWNPKNEQYYREMSQAIYAKSPKLLSYVLKKYDIKYVLVDKNVISPDGNSRILFFDEIDALLQQQDISMVKQFGQNLFVYVINSSSKPIFLLTQSPSVAPFANAFYEDFVFEKYGDYITLDTNNDIYYPFRDVIDNQNHFLPETAQVYGGISFALGVDNQKDVNYPSLVSVDDFIPMDIVLQKKRESLQVKLYPSFPLENTEKSPSPILLNAQSPNTNSFIVSVNNAENFTVNTLPEDTPYLLGKALLSTKAINTVSIYSDQNRQQFAPSFPSENYSLFICNQVNSNPVFGASQLGQNGFALTAKGSQVCMVNALTKLLGENIPMKENMLMQVSFETTGKLVPSLCIVNLNGSDCLSSSKTILASNVSSKVSSQYFTFSGKEYNNLGLKISLDARSENLQQVKTFENFKIFLAQPASSFAISPQDIQLSLEATKVNTNDTILKIKALYSGDQQFSQDITKIPRTSGDCPKSNPRGPQSTSTLISESESKNFIRYLSEDGSYCDHFSYNQLPRNQAYLISIVSRNVQGLPIRLCIMNNSSSRCDIYTHLGKQSDFKEELFLLAPIDEGQGFDVNINNFAIRGAPSINDVKSINIIPVPYNWLSQVSTGKAINQPYLRTSVNNINQFNSSLYTVKGLDEKGILTLSQSFNQGWKAYQVKQLTWFNKIFPFIFGKKIQEHVLVNNWENGWIIQGSDEKDIIIVYLPQYLEYLGFLIAILTFIGLVFRKRKID